MRTEEDLNKIWRNLTPEERVAVQLRSMITRTRIFEVLCQLDDESPNLTSAILDREY